MSVKEILQEIIIEHQSLPFPEIIKREIEIERIPRKATIVIGIRRCGKTTLMYQREKELIDSGIDRKAICFIDFSDDRLVSLRSGEPGIVAEAYYSLFPEMENEKVYFFFDEIQNLRSWELFINRMMNTRQCEINITGSSAKLLEKEASTEIGGRKLTWHLYPYSFSEFLHSRNIGQTMPHSAGEKAQLVNMYQAYSRIGGFPESQLFSSQSVIHKYLQNTANDIIYRDIIERYEVANVMAIKAMMLILAGQMSSKLSITKLYKRLRGMQIRVSKEAVGEYLSYFEDSFFLALVPIRSYNIAVISTNEKKVYLADHVLSAALSPQKQSEGLVLENIIAMHLIRKHGKDNIAYYRTPRGYEIDFAIGPDDDITLIQVSASLENEETRNREIRAIEEAQRILNPTHSYIITLSEEGEIETDSGRIHVIPAWKYLLFHD